MPQYFISGLRVSSELVLLGAIPDYAGAANTAVAIRRGLVPASLPDATARGRTWEIVGETFLLRVPRLARFLIESGREITVEIEPGSEERDATSFVLGSAFGILLHQRGALVLHGAAVEKDGRAIVICGAPGAGKSTLAAALCRNGYAFAADDMCVISADAQRRPVVLPDGRKLKLWKESIDKLDLQTRRGDAVRETFEKYYVDPFNSAGTPPRLAAIYVLRDARPPLQAGFKRLALPDAMRILEFEAYRPELRKKMGYKPELLAKAAATFSHAKVFVFIREHGFDHLAETVESLCTHWSALCT